MKIETSGVLAGPNGEPITHMDLSKDGDRQVVFAHRNGDDARLAMSDDSDTAIFDLDRGRYEAMDTAICEMMGWATIGA